MAQTVTTFAGIWRAFTRPDLRVSVHIDRQPPGSHLIWNVENVSDRPIVLTKLIVRGDKSTIDTVQLALPHVLSPQDRMVLPTDVDWGFLAAKGLAAVDVDGREYDAPRRELTAVRDQMRESIARPATMLSARDFLFGAANLTVGVAILGLGLFMLMWVIATG